MEETTNQSSELYAWEAPAFAKSARSTSWYLWAGLLVVLIVAYCIWVKLYLTAAAVVALAVATYFVGRMEPRHLQYAITTTGIRAGDTFYPYSDLAGFWIVAGEMPTLHLERKGKFAINVALHIAQGDMEKIRETLVRYIPETENGDIDTLDKMSRFLKL